MQCEVTVIVVVDVDTEDEGQIAANQILEAAAVRYGRTMGYGSYWTCDPDKFEGDYSDVPSLVVPFDEGEQTDDE